MKKSLALFICFLLACSPKYKTVVLIDYSTKRIDGASLVIAPINNCTIDYVGTVEEEFGKGDRDQLIKKHFTETFLNNMRKHSSFAQVTYDEYAIIPNFGTKSLDMDDIYKVDIELPTDTGSLAFKKTNPDFVLFISNIFLGTESFTQSFNNNAVRQNNQCAINTYPDIVHPSQNYIGQYSHFSPPMPIYVPAPMPNMYYSQPQYKYVRYRCNFAYWDNKLHKLVAYGRVCAKSKSDSYGLGVVQIIRMENWMQIDASFVNSILDNTPFAKSTASQEIFVPQEDTLK